MCAIRLAGSKSLAADLLLGVARSVRVQAQQHLLVHQGILLLHAGTLGARGAFRGADHALDLGRVDQSADVSLLDQGRGQEEVLLESGWSGRAAVDGIESGERRRCPDDEASEVAAGSELEEVEREHG